MLSGDCDVCHGSGGRFPVFLDISAGGTGLSAISCTGCHGREEDNTAANPGFPAGRGAGLRQHHTSAGVMLCTDCHPDANPVAYTPVGENVLPDYYANPGTDHPAMPTGPCNSDGSENFAGIPEGLDNDGDGVYDGADTDCGSTGTAGIEVAGAPRLESAPNPFARETTIRYSVDRSGAVSVRVYDVSGRLVRNLPNDRHQRGDVHEARWDGRDETGRKVPSGVYLVRVENEGRARSRTVVLLR
jgi:hypothetical protein